MRSSGRTRRLEILLKSFSAFSAFSAFSLSAFCILNSAFLFSGCSRTQAADPNVITIAVRSGPSTLDPLQAGDEISQRIGQLVFDPLMDFGDDLRVHPFLAERYETPDPRTYVFYLRRGVTFHDGHELTSRDVVYTFQWFLDPNFISPLKGAYRQLASVTAVDKYAVKFTLTEPFAAFPLQLVLPPIVAADGGDATRTHPIGTGPYRFVRYDTDDRVVLAPHREYWNGPPKNAGLVVKVVPDDTMRGLELRKESTDLVVNDLPPDIVYQLQKSDQFEVDRTPGLDFSYLGFNMRDPVVGDRRVRHAIGYAINRDAIIKDLRRGLARPAAGLVPDVAWAFEPDVHRFTYDPARAKRLLDEAGYPDPDGDGPRPRLTLSMKTSTNEETRLQSTVIQEDLRRVGINLELRSYEFATFYADIVRSNFQMFTLTWTGGGLVDPDMLRRVFHSQQTPDAGGFNRGHYRNIEVDRLIDLATTSLAEADRKRYYGAAQKLIAEDAPYIPIWHRTNVIVSQRTLSGLQIGPTGNFTRLKDVARSVTGAALSP